ncbi:VQ motif-containing protein 29-like [Andrographis paniculata]|uniref:VQ motif-containing protein 29-like n=1 Tax=Andrographis paniculata TaxID=175694 RepID=UPI0021E897F2|nr:VQ motif-containing protein 29-like [Andrographis paniculata]
MDSSYLYGNYQYRRKLKTAGNPAPAYRAALRSIGKFPAKNVIRKKPIAPMPAKPQKVYKVDPVDFKEVVQKLTGAEEFIPMRLQEVAPPPLRLRKLGFDTFGAVSPLGFDLSPASIAWCSTVLMSPGTGASMEPSAVV